MNRTVFPPLDIAPEVAKALDAGRAVVALESTIIAHGMPFPQNVETARALQDIIRVEGAVPATIAVMGGTYKVGLNDQDLHALATAESVRKLSRRDLPLALTSGEIGATTVASTMIIAAAAGIRLFATGGIGGVHRGAEYTFDVSADLTELRQTSVAVVSAGAKAILDLPKTLEMLETFGVPVLGVGTDEFPAFYSRTSGLGVDVRMDAPEQIATFLKAKWSAGLAGGVLIANPVPESDALDAAEIESTIASAIAEAAAAGIGGKQLTPFLLRRITELTAGQSLVSNVALVKNNARLAARIAVALAENS
ncbi:MAG: pseudouridine-5'-phosphate glycosidase [Flavobacteriales bacterium]